MNTYMVTMYEHYSSYVIFTTLNSVKLVVNVLKPTLAIETTSLTDRNLSLDPLT